MDPQTAAFTREFMRTYGRKRAQPDFRRCASWVSWDMRRDGKTQCGSPNGHGPHGAYCKKHGLGRAVSAIVNFANLLIKDSGATLDLIQDHVRENASASFDGKEVKRTVRSIPEARTVYRSLLDLRNSLKEQE